MSKQTGLGSRFFVGGYDLSGDINSLSSVHGGPAPIVMTDITQSGFERQGGQRDGSMEFVAYFDPAAGQAHPVLSALPTTDVIASYWPPSQAIGSPVAALVGRQVNYDGGRTDKGEFTFKCQVLADGYGLEWGQGLTAGERTDGSATNGTALDYGSTSTTFGGQAYLQVFAFAGTSVTVKLQDSADNSTFADLSGGAFVASTGLDSQRIAFSGTVRRYVRAVSTGTFSSAVFALAFMRNLTATVF